MVTTCKINGRPGVYGDIDLIYRGFQDIVPGDTITSIGKLSKNGKITSSRRVDRFKVNPATFAGWYFSEFYNAEVLAFELDYYVLDTNGDDIGKIYGLYFAANDDELWVSLPDTLGILIYKAKFNLY